MEKNCWTCRFWKDDGYDLSTSSHRGPCHRYPNTIIKGAAEGCGEWKSREEAQEAAATNELIKWADCGSCPYHNTIVAVGQLLDKCNAENMSMDCHQCHK